MSTWHYDEREQNTEGTAPPQALSLIPIVFPLLATRSCLRSKVLLKLHYLAWYPCGFCCGRFEVKASR
ncbi:hypothetical protein VNO80_08293 [Phaseolus coccineus]|uniref:Uncharacterized protein n=1 Tax=Phaseolus coccineus TaxID=3886 RepID=A0AAN9NKM8_PHACN